MTDHEYPIAEPAAERPELTVVIPAFNEAQTVGATLDKVLALCQGNRWEVVVVDDASTDDTVSMVESRLEDPNLRLFRHPYNRGYGAAIKTGITHARGCHVATMDSDGQHDAQDLLKLIPHMDSHELVVGCRPGLINSKLWRMPGKWLLGWLANYLTKQQIPDLNSGMRVFNTEVIRKYVHLCPNSFSFSTTSTLAFYDRGYAVKYVPISIGPRHPDSISAVTIATGFDTLLLIFRLASLFQPLRVFIPASMLFLIMGGVWGLPYLLLLRGVSVGALMLFVTGLLLFFFGLLADQVAQLRLEKFE